MLKKRHIKSTIGLLACLALLTGNLALAQKPRWFRVELLVFSHESPQTTEQWEATPTLAYPSPARFLLDAAPPIDAAVQQGEILPTPFVTLADEQLEFRARAARMQRSGRYRILFHETWVQPMAGKRGTLPIVLDKSGDAQQWPRLQGSITLFLSRYLHLETNLWLNTSGTYLPGTWQMPPPPLGPPSQIIKLLPQSDLKIVGAESAGTPDSPPAERSGPTYPFRHAVLLQQKRRMRSNEVHYIDHPLMGVIAKITPLTAEDLESLAQGQVKTR